MCARLIKALIFITIFLLIRSSLPLAIKVCSCLFLIYYLINHLRQKLYNDEIKSISFERQQWVLVEQQQKQSYAELVILIHNPYFQILQFVRTDMKRFVILFHDQASTQHRRLLHLQASVR
ncbi:MAG: hypothetical protein BGO90_05615 [Legionella sp. 40-6]|nr:MAG: hypothetical protein BGO90_05615 [Legionella sp. 40-6]